MYAAAGGASLASRQARKREQQQKTKNRELKIKELAKLKAAGPIEPAKVITQSKQFHQLPQNYLRTPNAQARKLSGGYTTQSKLQLLPISEGNSQTSGGGGGGGHQQQSHHSSSQHSSQHTPHYSDELRRQLLRKSATASLPLVSQAEGGVTPPTTPTTVCFNQLKIPGVDQQHPDDPNNTHFTSSSTHHYHYHPAIQIHDPNNTSPTDGGDDFDDGGPPHPCQLERKCSVYRGRELDDNNYFNNKSAISTNVLDFQANEECNTFHYNIPNGGGGGGGIGGHHHHHQPHYHKWASTMTTTAEGGEFCESEHRNVGVCTCDHSEVNKISTTTKSRIFCVRYKQFVLSTV